MKTTIILAALTLLALTVSAAEQPNLLPPVPWAELAQAKPQKKPENMTGGNVGALVPAAPKKLSWWTDFSVSPYVAWRNVDFTGKPIFGSGIGFGYQINKTVGIHLLTGVYDEPDTQGHNKFGKPCVVKENGWTSGTGIDESEILGRADLIQTGGKGNDRFVGFLLGSYTHSWEHDDEAIGAGGGFDIRLAKNFALELTYRVRAFFDHGEEGVGMAGLHFQW